MKIILNMVQGAPMVMSKRRNSKKVLFISAIVLILSTLLLGCTNESKENSTSNKDSKDMLTLAWPGI